MPRSIQTVERDRFSRKRRSWLISTTPCASTSACFRAIRWLANRGGWLVRRAAEHRARRRVCGPALCAALHRPTRSPGLRRPEYQARHHACGRVWISCGAEAGFDIGECCGVAIKVRLLRQIANKRARMREALAAVGVDKAGGDLQKRGFARAIAPDKANAIARRDGSDRRLPTVACCQTSNECL